MTEETVQVQSSSAKPLETGLLIVRTIENGCSATAAVGRAFKRYLGRRAIISNWVIVLLVAFIMLVSVFFKLGNDNFNNVMRMARDQQAIIEQQQEIIDWLATGHAEPLRLESPAY